MALGPTSKRTKGFASQQAEYSDVRESWTCDVPGAPVVIEFVQMRYLDPPVVIVREFRRP
jgi:hypothetical protein